MAKEIKKRKNGEKNLRRAGRELKPTRSQSPASAHSTTSLVMKTSASLSLYNDLSYFRIAHLFSINLNLNKAAFSVILDF